jgi:hypothetical protein
MAACFHEDPASSVLRCARFLTGTIPLYKKTRLLFTPPDGEQQFYA